MGIVNAAGASAEEIGSMMAGHSAATGERPPVAGLQQGGGAWRSLARAPLDSERLPAGNRDR